MPFIDSAGSSSSTALDVRPSLPINLPIYQSIDLSSWPRTPPLYCTPLHSHFSYRSRSDLRASPTPQQQTTRAPTMRVSVASIALTALLSIASSNAQQPNAGGIPTTSPSNALPGAVTTPPATSSSPPPASSASPTPSAPATPKFVFLAVPTATACAQFPVRWDLSVDRSLYKVDIYAYNEGVDQAIPPPSPSTAASSANPSASSQQAPASTPGAKPPASTPANPPANSQVNTPVAANPAQAPAANTPAAPASANGQAARAWHDFDVRGARFIHLESRATYNESVVKGQPAHIAYPWKVNLPQGRYRLFGIVNNPQRSTAFSEPFTVVEGADTSCINAKDISAAPVASDAQPSQTQSGASSAETAGQEAATGKKGISGGGIAGIVIGILAALVLAAIAFICFRRAQRDRPARSSGGSRKAEPKTPLRNLISKPRGKSMAGGMALASLGRGGMTHANDASSAELGEKPYLGGGAFARHSTRDTSDDPFQTAPSTPIEEKMMAGTPSSSFGSTAPMGTPRQDNYDVPVLPMRNASLAQRDASFSEMQSPSHSIPLANQQASNLPYERDEVSTYGRKSTPTPVRLPAAPLAPSLPGSQPTTPNTALTNIPSTPGASGRSPASHTSHPSSSSILDSAQSHVPPSSYPPSSSTPSSPGRKVERKVSLRRKPVPRLEGETEALSSDNGHELRPIKIADGPAGDEFGLNAALAGAGLNRNLSFKLMPDPPLEPRD